MADTHPAAIAKFVDLLRTPSAVMHTASDIIEALAKERDEAVETGYAMSAQMEAATHRAEAAEARIKALEEALRP